MRRCTDFRSLERDIVHAMFHGKTTEKPKGGVVQIFVVLKGSRFMLCFMVRQPKNRKRWVRESAALLMKTEFHSEFYDFNLRLEAELRHEAQFMILKIV